MNEGLTASDVLALTRNDENEMWNNPFIYLVWLAVLGGGGIFGGRGASDAAVQGAITRSDLFEGFNSQDVNGQLRGITSGICDGFYAVNSGMKDGFYGVQGALAENRFASQQCCCETNRNIDAVRYEGSKNTCEITNAIHAEGEATRALINANLMQELRDKLEARDRDILARDFQLSQLSQNAYLVNELRPCAKPAYITCSPYTTASFGCGTCGI
jgi:hypothetical protein